MCGVSTPEVWAGTRAEISVVAFGFVDPFPAQVLSEINVEWTHTAVFFVIPAKFKQTNLKNVNGLTWENLNEAREALAVPFHSHRTVLHH